MNTAIPCSKLWMDYRRPTFNFLYSYRYINSQHSAVNNSTIRYTFISRDIKTKFQLLTPSSDNLSTITIVSLADNLTKDNHHYQTTPLPLHLYPQPPRIAQVPPRANITTLKDCSHCHTRTGSCHAQVYCMQLLPQQRGYVVTATAAWLGC